jgi:glycosyltransferase involved in cell wall biosynthesis
MLAYLINQYPKGSHTFIRREIAAVEARGVEIARFSIRRCAETLVDPQDLEEARRTRVLLGRGPLGLVAAAVLTLVTRPVRFARAVGLAWRLGWRSDRGLPRHLVYLLEACVLERWLRDGGATHLHAHFGTNSAAVAMLCRALGGPPYSLTIHGQEEFDKPEAIRLGEKVQESVFSVAVSQYARAQLCRWTPSDAWPRIHVVRCGVDAEFLGRTVPPIPEAPRLVFVGRFDPAKGVLELVEAIGRLAAQGIPAELALIGDGPARPRIEEAVRRLGLQDRVTLPGWMSSQGVREQIVASRALVLPSFAENLPLVLMEALALGRPVVATWVGGVAELVQPGVSGWLVPPGTVDELADALADVLATLPDRLEQMGRAGVARVAQRHAATAEAGKLVDLFARYCPNGRAGVRPGIAAGGTERLGCRGV